MIERRKNWTNILFLTLTPVIGIVGTGIYVFRYGIVGWEPLLCLGFYLLIGLSVTAGYHRYFSHKSYECHPVLQGFFLFFGAMALENSLLQWASDHRHHHRYVDTEEDPYNIGRGGLWAHILWIFYSTPTDRPHDNVRDLMKNKLVLWQHRWSVGIGIIAGLGLPTLIGAAFGRPIGGLLWGGFLRIVIIHHTTFFVNSFAHLYGSRPYSNDNSARDNWLLAFVTNGEGYHNFHHKFPSDFRNGIRWFDWDPTKWFIQGLRVFGLVQKVKRTPQAVIDRARLRMTQLKVEPRLHRASPEVRQAVRKCLDNAHQSLERAIEIWDEVQTKYQEMRARGRQNAAALAEIIRTKIREYEECLDHARREWRVALRMLRQVPEAI